MKLAPRYIGPYKILRRLNPVSYALALPPHIRIHNVFHVSLLKPLLCNRYTKARAPPPPVSVEGEEEFEVKAILDARMSRGSLQYLVDWVGYGPEDRSWIPAAEVHAPRLVKAFYVTHPRAPGGRPVAARGGGGSVTDGPVLGRLAADSSLLAGQAPNNNATGCAHVGRRGAGPYNILHSARTQRSCTGQDKSRTTLGTRKNKKHTQPRSQPHTLLGASPSFLFRFAYTKYINVGARGKDLGASGYLAPGFVGPCPELLIPSNNQFYYRER
uniref:Chromo domain-containing protein n=1 Tax=Leptobrachium leishanense TaxID=445787 RepID=A0A8C5P708_9ANUR